MKKALLLTLIIALVLPVTRAGAQTISIHKQPAFRSVGAGWWQGNDNGTDNRKGYTVTLAGSRILLDTDFEKGQGPVNFHIGPFIVPELDITAGSFLAQIRLYPLIGVADFRSKDSRLDYGGAAALSAGMLFGIMGAGFTIIGRYTRDTRAIAICVSF